MAVKRNNTGQNNETMRLQDLIGLCISRWKWFVLSVFCTISIAVFYIFSTPTVYQRSAAILIKEDAKGSSSFSSELNSFADIGLFNVNTNVNNELTSIKSPAIILEVVKRLHLDMNYVVDGTFRPETLYGSDLPISVSIKGLADNDFCSFVLRLGREKMVELSDFTFNGEDAGNGNDIKGKLNDSIQTPIGKLIVESTPYYNNEEMTIKVSRSGIISCVDDCSIKLAASLDNEKSTIINISYQDVSIQRAEEFLNTLISVYNENWVKDKNQIAVSTSRFIDERLNVIEQELGHVDNDISSYKSEYLIPDVQAASNMYMTQANEANAQILALNNELYMARYIRNFISNDGNKTQLLPANSGINSAIIERQIAEYNEKMLQRNNLVANSSVSNPLAVDIDHSLSSMRKAIISSIDNQINSLNTQIRGFRASEQQSTARIASNPIQAKYLLSVERQQKVKEALYLFLLQKREENELSQAFTAYNTRIITPPTGKLTPTAPVKRNILLVAFFIGLVIPIAVIIIRENMNTKVRGRKDLERMTVPFIGEIPLHGKGKRNKNAEKANEYQILVKEKSRNVINEAFRVIRTNMEFMLEQDSKNKVIMLSSINSGSGKTFVAMNLAASFAIKEKRTIVLDLDMRKASLSCYVGTPKQGISDYLSNRLEDWKGCIAQDERCPYLDILPVGTIPPNPAELLFKPRLEQLLLLLREEYDIIIIDCPPIDIVADSSIIAKWTDMTIFIVRSGLMEREMLPVVESYYTDKKFHNMSMLLNGTTAYGHYGYHRYGYYYGYGYGGYTKDE